MIRQPIRHSSAVTSAGYDPECQELDIEFRSGEVYTYRDVPGYVYDDLVASRNAGKFISEHVRGRYLFKKN